jgi:hypothetical protein
MVTAGVMEPEKVARPKGRPKTSERDDATTKIDRKLYDKAFMVAKSKGIPVAELLTEICRGPVEKMYAQLVRSLDDRG